MADERRTWARCAMDPARVTWRRFVCTPPTRGCQRRPICRRRPSDVADVPARPSDLPHASVRVEDVFIVENVLTAATLHVVTTIAAGVPGGTDSVAFARRW